MADPEQGRRRSASNRTILSPRDNFEDPWFVRADLRFRWLPYKPPARTLIVIALPLIFTLVTVGVVLWIVLSR